jgi:hypothetical protein
MREPLMKRTGLASRSAVVVLGSAFSLLPYLAFDRNYPVNVDASWMMGLTAAWRQGEISGRDLYSTYGWLFQLLGAAADALHAGPSSPFDSIPLLVLLTLAGAMAAFGAVLLALRLPARDIALLYLAFDLLSIHQAALLRIWVALLAALWAVRASAHPDRRARIRGAIGAAAVATLGQLLTFEVGIYAVVAGGGTLLLLAALSRRGLEPREGALAPPRLYLETAAWLAGAFAAANLLLALFFWATGPAGTGLLDYHRLMLEIVSGYSYAQSLPWSMETLPTVVWLAILAYALLVPALQLRRFRADDLPTLAVLAVFSALLVKSASVRADLGHIALGSAPALLLFLLLGKNWTGRRQAPAAWIVLLAVLCTTWPGLAFPKLQAWTPYVTGKASLPAQWRELRIFAGAKDMPRPEALLASDPTKALLPFPYQNYWALLGPRRLFAPVIQAYQANRRHVEQIYVEKMERERGRFQILYSFDAITSHQFEGVQQVTRNPLIFEHIARSYQPVAGPPAEPGFLLLEPRAAPRDLPVRSLAFRSEPTDRYDRVLLAVPATCALLKLSLVIDYPVLAVLGRAAPVELRLAAGDRTVLATPFFAIEGEKEFDTYVSLIDPGQFRQIWTGPPGVPGKSFDRLSFHVHDNSLFAFRPNAVKVRNLACVNP